MNTKKHLFLDDIQVDRVTRILRAYKHPNRYRIIYQLLSHGSLLPGELASYLQLEECYIREHLQVLQNNDLVVPEESERGVVYAANEPKLIRLKKIVSTFVAVQDN